MHWLVHRSMENGMKSVLVPIDGSAAALRALSYALGEVQGRDGAQVHVLNVHPPMVQVWPGKLVTPEMIDAELRAEGRTILAPAEAAAQAAGVRCVPHVSIGAAAQEIAAYAHQHGCDVIVMGTRGMRAVADLVLGSVAHNVVRLSNVPVTLVK